MTHKLVTLNSFDNVISEYCGSGWSSRQCDIRWDAHPENVDLTGFTQANGHLIFDLKHSNWEKMIDLHLTLRWDEAASSGHYYFHFSDTNALQSLGVNSTEWTQLHLPLSAFRVSDVTTWDVSSTMMLAIRAWVETTDDNFTIAVKNAYFNYGDSIVEKFNRYILVSSGGGEAIELFPEYNLTLDKRKIQTDHRLWDGSHYSYKFGEYDQVKFEARLLPSSSANAVNSLWNNNTPSVFIMTNSMEAHFRNVKLTGEKKPFNKFSAPYIDLMDGKISMETYE